jgi:hypothetical protein
MNRQGHEGVDFFIGPEVEHTPAYSKRTLFVVGKPKLDQIERMAREYKTPHVFMGANHSFELDQLNGDGKWDENSYWNQTITSLLDHGFWVTLDYPAHQHNSVLKMLNPGIWLCRTFVPLLGVRIPKVQNSSVNLTIKIDDIDFAATNPGVWCLHHHEITDSNRFTDWTEYSTDEVLAPLAGPAEILPVKVPVTTSKTTIIEVTGDVSEEVIDSIKTDMNNSELGLDPEPTMTPETAEILAANTTTPTQAAEAYAGAVTEKKGKKK